MFNGIKYDKYKPNSVVKSEILRFLTLNFEHLFTLNDLRKYTKNKTKDIEAILPELISEDKVKMYHYKNEKMFKLVDSVRIIIEPEKSIAPKEHLKSSILLNVVE